MSNHAYILGIETSCDETAASIVDAHAAPGDRLKSNVVLSQLDEHSPYGGVVPEIAARAHISHIDRIVAEAVSDAGIGFNDIAGIAATSGPGLIGGVMVGLMTGKMLASTLQKPFIAINHLEAHALTVRLTDDLPFPYLLLLVSGGHCQLLMVHDVGRYSRLGTTIDDAVGEAFDKTAKMLGLGYPGGPEVERRAKTGDAKRFTLPRPMKGRPGCDFSFSGLKTAVRREIEKLPQPLSDQDKADICAGFQHVVGALLQDRVKNAMSMFRALAGDKMPAIPHLVVAGGVAANQTLRGGLTALCDKEGFQFLAPPIALCTDNGAMVAWAGAERFLRQDFDPLDTAPKARWPLDPEAAKARGVNAKA